MEFNGLSEDNYNPARIVRDFMLVVHEYLIRKF